MEQSFCISDNFRPKGQGIQFAIYLGKSFIACDKLRERFIPSAHSPLQILETSTSRMKKVRSIGYRLKVDTVPFAMKMIFVYTVSTKINATS